MSAIDDFGCDVKGCEADAAELVETDDGDRVLLCARHHAEALETSAGLASGRVLYWDGFSGWCLMPEPMEVRR